MFISHQLLQSVAYQIFIPNEKRQEFLQGSNRHSRCQGDRFDALTFQISQQASEVAMPVRKGSLAGEKRTKPFQQRSQGRLQ